MKKRFARGFVFLLALCLLLAAAPALADTVTAVEEHCYIRNAPGLGGTILYTVPVGGSAIYMGDTAVDNRGVVWYYALYDGVIGWMSGLQVSVSYTDADSDDQGSDTVIAVEEHCYIRNAPGLNGKILYTVPVGGRAAYLYDTSVDSRGVTWYYATYDGVTGWMSGLQVVLS